MKDYTLEKSVEMSLLLDFYGDVLSDKQREAMDLYYDEDLSLSEISVIIKLTRAGVRDRIVKSCAILSELEDKLHLAQRFGKMKNDVSALIIKLEALADSGGADASQLRESVIYAKQLINDI